MHGFVFTFRQWAFVASSAAITAVQATTPTFYYRQLQSLPGGRTQAAAIGNDGVVIGQSGDFNFGFHAYLSDLSGVLTNIDTLGCTDPDARAINAAGQGAIHGAWHHGGSNWTMAVLRYTPGVGLVNLGSLGGYNGTPEAISIRLARFLACGRWASRRNTGFYTRRVSRASTCRCRAIGLRRFRVP